MAIEPSDYQTTPKPRARVSPEAQAAPTCMFWAMVIGLGVMVGTMLMWTLPALGTLNWELLFR